MSFDSNISPLSTNTSTLVEHSGKERKGKGKRKGKKGGKEREKERKGKISSHYQKSLRACDSQFHQLVPQLMRHTPPYINFWLRVPMHPRGQYPGHGMMTS